MKNTFHLGLFALTIVFLTACSGWRLRGSEGHTQLANQSIYLSGQTSETYSLIEQQLNRKNTLSTPAKAQQHVIISKENWKRRSASVTTQAITAEYELTLTVTYRVLDAAQNILRPATNISISRSYTFDNNDIAGKNKEEALIRNDIRRALTRQILQQLQLLQKHETQQHETQKHKSSRQ